MYNKPKKEYVAIVGFVKRQTRGFFDELVREGKFSSRNEAVGEILSEYIMDYVHKSKQDNKVA